MDKIGFEEWMKKVDAILADSFMGLDSSDLPDCNYADWHEDGYSPRQACRMAVRYAEGRED